MNIPRRVLILGKKKTLPWWRLPDIKISDVIGAWAGVDALDFNASKINLVTPGLINLSYYSGTPDWNKDSGWYFHGNGYLMSSTFAAPTEYSMIVKFHGAIPVDQDQTLLSAMAYYPSLMLGLHLMPYMKLSPTETRVGYGLWSDTTAMVSPSMQEGVLAFTRSRITQITTGYRNGILDLPSIVTSGGLQTTSGVIFGISTNSIYVHSGALYRKILTPYQLFRIGLSMP